MIAANQTTSRRMRPPACPLAAISRVEAANHRRPECGLRAATARTLVLLYQPRVCLTTGKVVANETFVLWPHHKQGVILPGFSAPTTEPGDFTNLIGAWVLAEACREAAYWNTARVSVNVSARQLQSGVLPLQVAAALEQSGLPPGRLELELTEASLAGTSIDTLLALSAIRDLGVGLTLEDFGTGFASPSMLKRLPLTAMKLDRSLVCELPMSHKQAAVVRTVVETGRAMRLTTMAEGIETEAQRAFLSGVGCEEGQGSLFSHPVPPGQLRPTLGAARP